MSDGGAYLLMLAPGADRARMADYSAALPRLQSQFGGQVLALAPAPSIEQFGHNGAPQSVMLSAWNDMERLHRFWQSTEHQRAVARARGCENLLAIAIDGEARHDRHPVESIAVFLGLGPSPALLEAEGGCALALVRERAVQRLCGHWSHGDVAIYAWASAGSARRPLLSFSSGRGRAMLVPALSKAGGRNQAATNGDSRAAA